MDGLHDRRGGGGRLLSGADRLDRVQRQRLSLRARPSERDGLHPGAEHRQLGWFRVGAGAEYVVVAREACAPNRVRRTVFRSRSHRDLGAGGYHPTTPPPAPIFGPELRVLVPPAPPPRPPPSTPTT